MKKIRLFTIDGTEIPLEIMNFPGGEVKVRILKEYVGPAVRIEALLFNSDDIMALVMLKDALRRMYVQNVRLTMPYVPYARQDRVCSHGEAFSILAFADIINGLNFDSVVIYDPHSHVTQGVLARSLTVPSYKLIRDHAEIYHWICRTVWSGVQTYLVCPDEGAIERTEEIASRFSFHGIIYAKKIRDQETGRIEATTIDNVPEDIKGSNLLIVDDICDGGRTFIELGKVLQKYEPREMNLYVTHGIFSQGKDVFDDYFNNVWCTVDFTKYKK